MFEFKPDVLFVNDDAVAVVECYSICLFNRSDRTSQITQHIKVDEDSKIYCAGVKIVSNEDKMITMHITPGYYITYNGITERLFFGRFKQPPTDDISLYPYFKSAVSRDHLVTILCSMQSHAVLVQEIRRKILDYLLKY